MIKENDTNQAMILAAGKATRLYPLTSDIPKVLLPVGGKPLLAQIIDWLSGYGIDEIAINLHYMGKQIEEFALTQSYSPEIQLSFSWEEETLGTAGGVKKLESFFRETFVVIYGDIYTNLNLQRMMDFHREKNALITLALYRADNVTGKGVVEMDSTGKITHFIEKPANGIPVSHMVNSGVYIMEKEALAGIPGRTATDFAYDVFPALLKSGHNLYGYPLEPFEFAVDIGTPEGYQYAQEIATGEGLTQVAS